MRCCPMQGKEERNKGVMQRNVNQGEAPPYPRKKYLGDATWDFFTPYDVKIAPREGCTMDTGISCEFPKGKWCLLKEKFGLAHRYGPLVLGGG